MNSGYGQPVNLSKSSEAPASVESAVSATDTAEGKIPATEAPLAENQALQTENVTAGTQPEQGSLEGSDKKE